MRYSRIDLLGTSIDNYFDHKNSMESLADWAKGIQLGSKTARPIKQEDGVIEYKISESAYKFLIPETHPLYNCSVIINSFSFPSKMLRRTRNAAIDHLKQLRH